MNKKIKIGVFILLMAGVIAAATLFFQNVDVAVLNPKGEIAQKQRDLIVFTVLLVSVVVVPVYTLLAVFSWRYRDSNKKAKYRPNWSGNKLLEAIWWGIPCVIILILSVVTWRTSHELDPYKTIVSKEKPITVQVVALQWKWLFIYPEQRIASVGVVQFPKDTPVNFVLTGDAPMNSFWIPSLGSQVYAMSGMSTKLHLIASETGDYRGSSANISGKGFADMTFTARASSQTDFNTWVDAAARSPLGLDMTTYNELAKPGTQKQPVYYSLKDENLYDKIVMKYMAPPGFHTHETAPKQETLDHHDHTNMEGM